MDHEQFDNKSKFHYNYIIRLNNKDEIREYINKNRYYINSEDMDKLEDFFYKNFNELL
jgi:tRNA A22 N-methylase